ncbi:TRAP transporter fused permease subunit [Alkalihalobacillus sp. BA299]|uniref:TRAP transporter permease n=1 Tax=Alkalihalobacillus sp. BA299 TaxID=2815938 RepID=UPI001ADB2AC5|nr:TRAP transporter fused permease subunit [Alkalihalobacillus sp. BA299]
MKYEGLDRILYYLQYGIAVLTAFIFLYTAYFGAFEAVIQRSLLLLGALLWAYVFYAKKSKTLFGKVLHLVLALISAYPCIYLIVQWDEIVRRYGIPLDYEYLLGATLVGSLIYIGIRTLGWGFSIIVSMFIVYALAGPMLPGIFKHSGVSMERLLTTTFLTTQGIWGIVMNVASTTIIQFVIFAAFLRLWGAGDFFMNLSSSLFGYVRGGPAKIAVIGSGLTGMFNGVATANVASTGSITIPLMKRNGYPSTFAGAVEASASTGGQILPPIMGASAFVMAETLGVPIWEIMKAAFIPAMLFFLAIYLAVDFKAAKLNLKGLKKEELPNFKNTMKEGWLYIIPIIVLVVAVYLQYSPGRAAFLAIVTLLVLGFFLKNFKPSWKKLFEALKSGAEDTVLVTIACALAGIVIGVLNITGLGVSLGGMLISLASGVFILLIVFTMIASIILGMGLPTIAGYIIVSLTIAPVLITRFDIVPVAAHLFVFYFAILSVLTPPVAVASFVAAGIAKANPVKTGWIAFAIAIPCFIVPFIFIYNPEVLLIGSTLSIVWKVFLAIICIYSLAAGIQGFHRASLDGVLRVCLFVAALLLVSPNLLLDLLGILLFLIVIFMEHRKIKKENSSNISVESSI